MVALAESIGRGSNVSARNGNAGAGLAAVAAGRFMALFIIARARIIARSTSCAAVLLAAANISVASACYLLGRNS